MSELAKVTSLHRPYEMRVTKPDLWQAADPPPEHAVQQTLDGQPATERGLVYFAWDGCYLKLGYTTRSPKRRGGELDIEIIFSVPGTPLLERQLHRRYAALRMGDPDHSEWYWPADELIGDLFYIAGCGLMPGPDKDRAYRILNRIRRRRIFPGEAA
jgi:hypothetical protein